MSAAMRKYSIDEIDAMRAAVQRVMLGRYPDPMEQQMHITGDEVERRLRTLMINGTSPEELEASAVQGDEAFTEFWNAAWKRERAAKAMAGL